MKLFTFFFLFFISTAVIGQSKIEYIEQQLTNLEMELKKHNQAWALDNIQKSKLIQIFDEKYTRASVILNSKMEKLEVSNNLTKIDNEFRPKVSAVLTVEQRVALNKQETIYMIEK